MAPLVLMNVLFWVQRRHCDRLININHRDVGRESEAEQVSWCNGEAATGKAVGVYCLTYKEQDFSGMNGLCNSLKIFLPCFTRITETPQDVRGAIIRKVPDRKIWVVEQGNKDGTETWHVADHSSYWAIEDNSDVIHNMDVENRGFPSLKSPFAVCQ